MMSAASPALDRVPLDRVQVDEFLTAVVEPLLKANAAAVAKADQAEGLQV